MDRIARAVEPSIGYRHQLPEAERQADGRPGDVEAACDLAEALGAKALLVPTFTGARRRPSRGCGQEADHRPDAPPPRRAADGARVGRDADLDPGGGDVEDLWAGRWTQRERSGLVAAGDLVVITAGTAVNMPGSTNVIKVDTA